MLSRPFAFPSLKNNRSALFLLQKLIVVKVTILECWEELVEECLGYDVVGIRSSAVAALPAFLTEYFGGNFGPTQEAIVDSYIGQLAGHNQLSRMGHAQALGALPNSFLEPKLEAVADALIKAARISPDTVKWAECRRDAVKALSTICVNIEPSE